MLVSFVTLLLSQLTPVTRTTFNNIPAGPIAIIFAVLYQYMRLVPPAYHFKVFGVGMSDKIWVYAIAIQVCEEQLTAQRDPSVGRAGSDTRAIWLSQLRRGAIWSRLWQDAFLPVSNLLSSGLEYLTTVVLSLDVYCALISLTLSLPGGTLISYQKLQVVEKS